MRREHRSGLAAYRFESLPDDRVDAFVSTRTGGESVGMYASLNLGFRVEDDEAAVRANRERLFGAFGLPLQRSVWCKQIHRDAVRAVTADDLGRGALAEDGIIEDTDALITDLADVPLCVTLADCVPVVIYDPDSRVVGLAHAGWGGTVRRISSRTVAAMDERWGSEPNRLVAAVGPSIARADYEVGEEVVEQARESFGEAVEEIIEPLENGKARFDLWRANAIDLEQAGVASSQIEISAISTAAHLDEFYSHRIEGTTGRFICAVTLRPRS